MSNLLELQELLRNIPMGAVKGAAGGQHPTVPQWMAMDEIKRRGENMKAEQAQKSEEGVQDPAMIEKYLAAAQQLEGGQPPMGQPPMGQPPMGQPPMGQPPMGPPQMGPPQQGPPGMGGPPPQMGQMAQLGQLSAMAQQAQQPPAPRRPMPRRPPMQGGQGIRQLAAGGGLIKGYQQGGDVYDPSTDERSLLEKLYMSGSLSPEDRAKLGAYLKGQAVDSFTGAGDYLTGKAFDLFAGDNDSQDRPAGLYPAGGPSTGKVDHEGVEQLRPPVRHGFENTEDVYGILNWLRRDQAEATPLERAGGVAKEILKPLDPVIDYFTPETDYASSYYDADSSAPSTVAAADKGGADKGAAEKAAAAAAAAAEEERANRAARLMSQSQGEGIPDLQALIMKAINGDEGKELAQKKFNAWQALAMGGAAAMGSGDPNALGAIGKGAQEGLGSFATAQNVDIAQRGKSLDRAIKLAAVNASEKSSPPTFLEWQKDTWPKLAKEMGFVMETMGKDSEALIELQKSVYEKSYGRMRRSTADPAIPREAFRSGMNRLRGGG